MSNGITIEVFTNTGNNYPPVQVIQVEENEQPIIVQTPEYYAPVQSVNGKIGWVTITKEDLGITGDFVYTVGDQNISGTKNFIFRPTINGTGVLLSGEAANLSFSTGSFLYISSACYTGNEQILTSGYIDPKVSGYYYQKSITEYYKIQPGGKLTWLQWNRNVDGKIEILSRDGVNDTPVALYTTTNVFTSPPDFLNPSIIWKPNLNNGNPTGCMPKIFKANFEDLLNYESNIITTQLPSTLNTVQEYKVETPYNTTIGGYGYQFTKDTPAPEVSYDSWLMLRDAIYDRTYNATPIPLSAVFSQLLEFTSSVPTSPTGIGLKGAVAYDGRYLYICVNTNTWRRITVSTW